MTIYECHWVIGQSLAVGGNADADDLPAALQAADQEVLYWPITAVAWEALRPLNGSHGPEITLGHRLKNTGRNVAVFKAAVNATGLQQHWIPAAADLYPATLALWANALAALPGGDSIGQIHVHWVGCQRDAQSAPNSALVRANLEALLAALRTDVSATLTFHCHLIHADTASAAIGAGNVDTIRAQMVDFVANNASCYLTNCDDYPLIDEGGGTFVHLASPATQAMGLRHAHTAMHGATAGAFIPVPGSADAHALPL